MAHDRIVPRDEQRNTRYPTRPPWLRRFFIVARYADMTRSIALLSAAFIAAPLAAPVTVHAAAAPAANVSAAFGNTVLIIDPDGRSRKIWLQPNGAWTGLSRRGLDLAGKWTVKGDRVCLSQSKPRLPGSLCQTFPTAVGVGISAKDPSGKTVTLKLVKGRVTK